MSAVLQDGLHGAGGRKRPFHVCHIVKLFPARRPTHASLRYSHAGLLLRSDNGQKAVNNTRPVFTRDSNAPASVYFLTMRQRIHRSSLSAKTSYAPAQSIHISAGADRQRAWRPKCQRLTAAAALSTQRSPHAQSGGSERQGKRSIFH